MNYLSIVVKQLVGWEKGEVATVSVGVWSHHLPTRGIASCEISLSQRATHASLRGSTEHSGDITENRRLMLGRHLLVRLMDSPGRVIKRPIQVSEQPGDESSRFPGN